MPLFEGCDPEFFRLLAMNADSYVFCPGDFIVYAGDIGQEMYCVRRGIVEVRIHGTTTISDPARIASNP